MADWREMALACLEAAKKLSDARLYRRSVSSSYYAAYSAITATLVKRGVTFAHGWNNPAHEQMPDLILNNTDLHRSKRYLLNKAIRRLRLERENADYRPKVMVDRRTALNSIHDVRLVFDILEMKDNGS